MNNQQNFQFYYYPIKLWIDSIMTIIMFISLTLIFLINKNQPFGIVITLFIWFIGRNHFLKTIKNLNRILNKKPAIELTDDYFYDHINNIKIYWKNINKTSLISIKSNTYICFDLKDIKSYIIQSKSILDNFLFKINLYDEELFVKTEISLVKGKNEEIFNKISTFHKIKSN